MSNLNDSVYIPWLLMAVGAPLIVLSAQVPVLTAGAAALLCMITYWKPETRTGGILPLFRWLAVILLLTEVLELTPIFWQSRGAYYVIPAVLLILSVLGSIRGPECAAQSSNIMRYGFWAVMAMLMLSAAADVRLQNLQSREMIPSAMLGTVLLIPTFSEHKGKRKSALRILSTAVISAVMCQGVLRGNGDFRTLSRSLSLFGTLHRFESLASAAITLGFYSTVTFLLTVSSEEFGCAGLGTQKMGVYLSALLAAGMYCLPWELTKEAVFCAVFLLFTVFPALKALL